MTHICVGNLITIGSYNGLPPGRRQAIIWSNTEILLFWPLGTNFSKILIEIQTFSNTFENIVCEMSISSRTQCIVLMNWSIICKQWCEHIHSIWIMYIKHKLSNKVFIYLVNIQEFRTLLRKFIHYYGVSAHRDRCRLATVNILQKKILLTFIMNIYNKPFDHQYLPYIYMMIYISWFKITSRDALAYKTELYVFLRSCLHYL